MGKNAPILWQWLACLLQAGRKWLLRVVNKRLPNVLIVNLVLFGDRQRLDHRRARDGCQLAKLVMVVVLGGT